MKPHDTKCSETSSNVDDTLTYGHAIVHMLITVARTPPRRRRNPTPLNHAWSSNKQKAGGSCMQVRSRWTPAKAMWLHHSREKLFPLASSLPCPRPMGHWPHRTTNTSRKFAGGDSRQPLIRLIGNQRLMGLSSSHFHPTRRAKLASPCPYSILFTLLQPLGWSSARCSPAAASFSLGRGLAINLQ